MAVGKISYNGGSGVKGAEVENWVIASTSPNIQGGNFVQKTPVGVNSSELANDIVIDTVQMNAGSSVALGDGKVIMAYSSAYGGVLRLYDTTNTAIPTLLDEVMFAQNNGISSIGLEKYSNNSACLVFTISSGQIAQMVLVNNNLLELKTALTVYSSSNSQCQICKLASDKFLTTSTTSGSLVVNVITVNADFTLTKNSSRTISSFINPSYRYKIAYLIDYTVLISYGAYNYTNSNRMTMLIVNPSSSYAVSYGSIFTTETMNSPKSIIVFNESTCGVFYHDGANINCQFIDCDTTSNGFSSLGVATIIEGVTTVPTTICTVEYAPIDNGIQYYDNYLLTYDGHSVVLGINLSNYTCGYFSTIASLNVVGSITTTISPTNYKVCIFTRTALDYPYLVQVGIGQFDRTVTNLVPIIVYHDEMTLATTKIDGVAKKSGSAGDTITVYVLGGE